jgi:hypothetical protein
MTRPRKQTVDYFPHTCHHGKTMFIIEQRYGNDGYAFWFKLLELLGDSEGHFIDCRNPAVWEYLRSITRQDEQTTNDLLNLLAKLDAIDSELWAEGIVWSENFIKGISEVYRNRRVEIPSRPDNYNSKTTRQGITTCRKPQMKVDESRVDETRVKDIASPAPGNGDARPQPPAFQCECFEITPEYLGELCQTFPLLPEAYLLQEFFPRMRNWCLDNRKIAKHLKKFDAKGRLKSPRSCFANWLKKEDPARAADYTEAPRAPTLPPDPPDILIFDPECPVCHGDPFVTMGKCKCGRTKEAINAATRATATGTPATA